MALDIGVQYLRKLALFNGLSPLQITEIARRTARVVYQPGQTIIEENKQSDGAVLIISGLAIRVSGPGLTAKHEPLHPGTLVSEMAMLVETQHSSTVLAHKQVRALHICRDDLLNQMGEDPSLADHFMTILTERLSTIADELRMIETGLNHRAPNATPSTVSFAH